MQLDRLRQQFELHADELCLVSRRTACTYRELEEHRQQWLGILQQLGLKPGTVVGLKADYSITSVSLLLALFSMRCIVGLIPGNEPADEVYLRDSCAEAVFRFKGDTEWDWSTVAGTSSHRLIAELRAKNLPGFIIFSSGSSGRPKAALHSLESFLEKFSRPGKRLRTLAFLLFDHIAGFDTLFYTLCQGATLVLPDSRDPRSVCRAIDECGVEVLPVSPTFLNLLCLSQDYKDFDLSSLRIITYGSEPMGEATLQRVCAVFPDVKIIQKYGTSEFGAPRCLSRGNDSLWLRLKPDECQAKIVSGALWVRSPSAMLGYLNAPSPFDADGWYCTGDIVEEENGWIRILGRQSDVINVGGQKVYPSEVEATILQLDFVQEALVRGEKNHLTGQFVAASVKVNGDLDTKTALRRIRQHCRAHLAPFKRPVRVEVTDRHMITDRQKKIRRQAAGGSPSR